MNDNIINRVSDNIRILSAAMVEKAQSGHPGGPMGGADFVNVLYSEFLQYHPDNAEWFLRDRFFLDAGHMSPMLYSILTLTGRMTVEDLKNFRQWGSCTPGHPELDLKRGIENTSGPLGQGHIMAIGAAIAERFLVARFGDVVAHKTYAYISDGGVQEEVSQGGGRIAGHLGLHNLIMFYDANDIQLSTRTEAVTNEDTARKYEAWGWYVQTIEGNNAQQIRQALNNALNEKKRPSLIIGKTIMGKGAVTDNGHSFEGEVETHGQPLSKAGASFEKTVQSLGGNPQQPFELFADTVTFYQQVTEQKRKAAQQRQQQFEQWEKANPDKAAKLQRFLSNELPALDFENIKHKENQPTRNASASVLSYLAKNVENMVVMSADLANSDKTDGFLKETRQFTATDFGGAFLQAGVAELTMAGIANGMALHGGVIPACGTFFVFSDYMKPAIRLAALMQLPVIYIWTHDAFRVGEDGPTHQPIEQEAQIRLLEELRNHHGDRSMLVLRPADSVEATVAWKMALENRKTPTGLIFSRQNINDIPAQQGSTRYKDALQSSRGAYVVQRTIGRADVVLVGNGSEVATLLAGAQLLAQQQNLNVQVVSVISEGLFNDQDIAYRQSVIQPQTPVFGLTAGLPVTLYRLVGERGRVWGLSHFGYSAPAKVLDEKFGFTPQNLQQQVIQYLQEYKRMAV